MAKFIEMRPPSQPTYIAEFTQDEWDVIGGLVNDLSDNRGVVMDYTKDESRVVPTERGLKALVGMRDMFRQRLSEEYEYFDFWQDLSS